MGNYISIINDELIPVLINASKITGMQLIQQGNKFTVNFQTAEMTDLQEFDSLKDAARLFDKVTKRLGMRPIQNDNDDAEILKNSVNPELAACIKLRRGRDNVEKDRGAGFIVYVFKASHGPFDNDIIASEKFPDYKDAEKQFNIFKKQFCFGPLEVVDKPEYTDAGE